MRVLINPYCDFGRGREKWESVAPALRQRFGDFQVQTIDSPRGLISQVRLALEEGETVFIAAGGDGTVNLVLNALLACSDPKGLVLGAVGLGSSNDFHKPFRPEATVAGTPVRMDVANSRPCDVIAAQVRNCGGPHPIRYSLINASVGITAEANAFYNSRRRSIVLAKRLSHGAAVIAAALRTIIRYRNIIGTLSVDGDGGRPCEVTNLGIVKNPHFAGSLCYDTEVAPDDGTMAVNLSEGMTRKEAVSTLLHLYRREFSGRPKTRTWRTNRLVFESAHSFALELDGEILTTDRAVFSLQPKLIRCCS